MIKSLVRTIVAGAIFYGTVRVLKDSKLVEKVVAEAVPVLDVILTRVDQAFTQAVQQRAQDAAMNGRM